MHRNERWGSFWTSVLLCTEFVTWSTTAIDKSEVMNLYLATEFCAPTKFLLHPVFKFSLYLLEVVYIVKILEFLRTLSDKHFSETYHAIHSPFFYFRNIQCRSRWIVFVENWQPCALTSHFMYRICYVLMVTCASLSIHTHACKTSCIPSLITVADQFFCHSTITCLSLIGT